MGNFISDLLSVSQALNFELLFKAVGFYLFIMWVSIVFWIYADALTYTNSKKALLYALMVFILFIPGLIFYFAIRKSYDHDEVHVDEFEVPITTVVEENGAKIEITLNLTKIHHTEAKEKVETQQKEETRNPKRKISMDLSKIFNFIGSQGFGNFSKQKNNAVEEENDKMKEEIKKEVAERAKSKIKNKKKHAKGKKRKSR